MCGRYQLIAGPEEIAGMFLTSATRAVAPRYNIAPTQAVAAVRAGAGGRELALLRWGLIPAWAKDAEIGARMINARAETLAEKASFRGPLRSRRCLVLADGFYEWQRVGAGKVPHHVCMADRRPFAFAGLWDRWLPPGGEPLESCTIVTTTPNELLAEIHDRMPVILPPEAYGPWLDPAHRDTEGLQRLLQPFPASLMRAYPVSPRVNSPRNDDRGCIAELAG